MFAKPLRLRNHPEGAKIDVRRAASAFAVKALLHNASRVGLIGGQAVSYELATETIANYAPGKSLTSRVVCAGPHLSNPGDLHGGFRLRMDQPHLDLGFSRHWS